MNSWTARWRDEPDPARWGLIALALVIGAFLAVCCMPVLGDDAAARGEQANALPTQGLQVASDAR